MDLGIQLQRSVWNWFFFFQSFQGIVLHLAFSFFCRIFEMYVPKKKKAQFTYWMLHPWDQNDQRKSFRYYYLQAHLITDNRSQLTAEWIIVRFFFWNLNQAASFEVPKPPYCRLASCGRLCFNALKRHFGIWRMFWAPIRDIWLITFNSSKKKKKEKEKKEKVPNVCCLV